jgi:hypothetical protein
MVYGYQNPKVRVKNRRLAILFALTAVLASVLVAYNLYDYIKGRERPKIVPTAVTESVHIFVPGEQAKLVEKKIEVKLNMSERQKADFIISALKKEKCLPEELKLYDFAADEDGIMYLNFSKEFQDDKVGTSREITMAYSIVNSFISNFKNISKVQLLAEGQPVQTMGGLIHVYKPIEFNKGLLED